MLFSFDSISNSFKVIEAVTLVIIATGTILMINLLKASKRYFMAIINMSHPDQSQHNRTKTFHECLFTRRETVFLIFNFRVNNSCQLT